MSRQHESETVRCQEARSQKGPLRGVRRMVPNGGMKKPEPEPGTTGWKLRQLRLRLGMKRDDVVAKSGMMKTPEGFKPRLSAPAEVSKAELNTNSAESEKWRGGFSAAYEVSRDDLADYIDDLIGLDELIARRRTVPSGTALGSIERHDPFVIGASAAILDGATVADIEAARNDREAQVPSLRWKTAYDLIMTMKKIRERSAIAPANDASSEQAIGQATGSANAPEGGSKDPFTTHISQARSGAKIATEVTEVSRETKIKPPKPKSPPRRGR